MSVGGKLRSRLRGVATTTVRDRADVQAFFDRCAATYSEQHGHRERLLTYRIGLVRKRAQLRPEDVVLDVGCGPGDHLLAMAPEIARGMGIDLSPAMIEIARVRRDGSPFARRLDFQVDDAEQPRALPAASVDLALGIGVLEHVLDKRAALTGVHRALKPGGRFFCLTPAGDYLWYRKVAPLLGLSTRHLSTDTFLTRDELIALLAQAGFSRVETGSWTFIPKGDMPRLAGLLLEALDVIGRGTGLRTLRGGLWICAWKD